MRSSLICEELKRGLLINPLKIPVNTPIAYYLVYDESAVLQKICRRFRDWITATAANEFPAIDKRAK
ncbi:MAG: hypothetical protein E7L23_01525 [Klebsiella grimontii]|uniref:hypothetical protein n=1 Tax=Klebsiella TaxID=570 RepID=UPI001CCAACB5|nr:MULTISPECIES: hypothetical protein [Klebsiella]MDU7344145.1 hypothetical protein [Klebsiella grimontii]